MKRNIFTTVLLIAFFTLSGVFSANAQTALAGSYIYEVKAGQDAYNFTLKFEPENAVYYSYAYQGYGTLGGRWTVENGLLKVVLSRGDETWSLKLKSRGADLELAETFSKSVNDDEVPDFGTILPIGTIFKKDTDTPTGPDLTAGDFSRRTLELIKSIRGLKDLSAENIERRMKAKVSFNKDDRNEYGFGGNVTGAPDWFYGVIAYPYPSRDNKTTDTLHFSFDYQLHEPLNPDLSPVCNVSFTTFGKKLAKAGFSAPTPVRGNHNVIIYWQSSRGKTSLNISAGSADKRSNRLCVKMVTVGFTN